MTGERPTHRCAPGPVERPTAGVAELSAATPGAVTADRAFATDRRVARESGPDLAVRELRLRGTVDTSAMEAGVERWASLADHEGVLGLVDWAVEPDCVRLLVEHADGGTLADRTRTTWPDEAVWVGQRLCTALVHAHERGETHLTVAPATVALRETPPDSFDLPVLDGWGVRRSAIADDAAVADHAPAYAAPEQLDPAGDPDERTDIYRLGAVLYELLTGRPPHEGTAHECLRATLAGTRVTPPGAAWPADLSSLDTVILRALEPDPADRYPDAATFRAALAAVDVPSSLGTAATAGSFPQYAAGPANRGVGDATLTGETDLDEHWRTRLNTAVETAPAVASGTVYVGGTDGSITALRADTGEKRWTVTADSYAPELYVGGVEGSPAVTDGKLLVATDACVVALDAATGAVRWRREFPAAGEPTVSGERLYVVDTDAVTVALDTASGETVWRTEFEASIDTGNRVAPAVAGGRVFLGTTDCLVALDAETGERRWQFPVDFPRPPSVAVTDTSSTVYVGDDDTVYALDATDGGERWRETVASPLAGPPVVDGDSVHVTVRDEYGGVVALDADTGDRRWTYDLETLSVDREPVSNAVLVDETVVLVLGPVITSAERAEEVVALGAADGTECWRYPVGDRDHTPPVPHDDRLLLADDCSDVTAYSLPVASPEAGTDTAAASPEAGTDTAAESETDTGLADTGADATDTASEDPDIDRTAARAVCDVLAAQPDGEYDLDWLPEETGLPAERVETVVADLEDWGFVAVDEFDDVGLVGDPDIGDGPRSDAAVLALVLQDQIGNALDRDWLPEETGWSEERTERVVSDLEQRGVVEVDDWGEVRLVGDPDTL